jgi:hypothetical protein
MTAVTSEPRTGTKSLTDWVIDLGLLAFFLVGVAYLAFKTVQVADRAGFDFRYMWLAGKLWAQGVNPYVPEYRELGSHIITAGHVPTLWPYPPNWVIPSFILAQADLTRSAVLFNVFNVAAFLASSLLLTVTLYRAPPRPGAQDGWLTRLGLELGQPRNVFFLHVGVLAVLQATALVLSTGQNSILIYLGLSLLLYGLARRRQLAAAIGLTLMLLKPQLGVIFVAVLLMNRAHWGLVLKAVAISALISVPAFIVSPSVAFDWLTNLGLYDGMNTANAPQAMTGIRNLAFDALGRDIGNMAALAIALAVTVGLCLGLKPRGRPGETLDALILATAVAVALAPLHNYDLVIVGVTLFAVAWGGALERLLGTLGALAIWRADDLAAATGFYNPAAQHFEGSRIATLGGILMLIAVYGAIRRPRVSRGEPILSPA